MNEKKNNVCFIPPKQKTSLRLQKMCKAVIAHRKPKNVSHARHAHCKFQPKWIGMHIATCNSTLQFISCGRTSATHDLQCTFSGTYGKNVHEKRYILSPVVQKDGKIKKHFFIFTYPWLITIFIFVG